MREELFAWGWQPAHQLSFKGSSASGVVTMSSTSGACCWWSCDTTKLNLVLWRVTAAISNCASACANQRAGQSGQKGDRRTATLYTVEFSLVSWLHHAKSVLVSSDVGGHQYMGYCRVVRNTTTINAYTDLTHTHNILQSDLYVK